MLDGLNSMLEDIGFSIKDSIDKVKDTATEAGKTYMASSPYGQAAQRGGAIFGQKTSGNTSRFTPSVSPSSSPSPSYTPSGTRVATKNKSFAAGLKRGTLRQVLTGKKRVFGIPVLFLLPAGIGGFFLYKKLKKRK